MPAKIYLQSKFKESIWAYFIPQEDTLRSKRKRNILLFIRFCLPLQFIEILKKTKNFVNIVDNEEIFLK